MGGGANPSGMGFEALPEGWQVWSDEETRVVLAYRPDVFDTAAFPAPCLPTMYLSKGQRDRRPGPHDPPPDADWFVTLYLEPEVSRSPERADDRAAAESVAVDLATAFNRGELDMRSLYQVPRDDYLDRLDEMVGPEQD
jgi:hypothetical protein